MIFINLKNRKTKVNKKNNLHNKSSNPLDIQILIFPLLFQINIFFQFFSKKLICPYIREISVISLRANITIQESEKNGKKR